MAVQGGNDRSVGVISELSADRGFQLLELLQKEYEQPAQVAFLSDRFGYSLVQIRHNSRQARTYFVAARVVVIGSGALLPAIVTLQSQSHGAAHAWLTACAIALSVLVAITAGLMQTSRLDQRWKAHHWAYIALRTEGWALASRRSPYADEAPAARFSKFVENVESTLQTFESAILALTGNGSDEPGANLGLAPRDGAT